MKARNVSSSKPYSPRISFNSDSLTYWEFAVGFRGLKQMTTG